MKEMPYAAYADVGFVTLSPIDLATLARPLSFVRRVEGGVAAANPAGMLRQKEPGHFGRDSASQGFHGGIRGQHRGAVTSEPDHVCKAQVAGCGGR